MATTISNVKAVAGKAGDTITVTGTGFLDGASESVILCRKHGDTAWTVIDPSRITYVAATSMTFVLNAAEFDEGGLWDIGVGDVSETTPDDYLESALYFYTAGTDNPDAVVVGPIQGVYLDGRYMGDLLEEVAWSVNQEVIKIFTQHSRAPVKTYPGTEEHEITIPLAEFSLENLADLFNSTVTDLSGGRRRVTFGGSETLVDRDLLLIGPGVEGKANIIGFYRCNVGLSGSITFGKDSAASVPLKVTVLEDTSREYGDRLGYAEEYTVS
jgi:hypothetical protein